MTLKRISVAITFILISIKQTKAGDLSSSYQTNNLDKDCGLCRKGKAIYALIIKQTHELLQ